MPSISVVIPARDRAKAIGRALDSVVAQTLPPLEVIVVDDGSADDTTAVAQSYADRITNLRVIRRAVGEGAPTARNVGIAQARGDLIALLDSDDAWHPTKLDRQLELMDEDVAAVFTNIRYMYSEGRHRDTQVGEEVTLDDLFHDNLLGGCSTALCRKEQLDRVGGFDPDLPSCQDWDLWLRLAMQGRIRVAGEPLTFYYFDATNRISSAPDRIERGNGMMFSRIGRLARLHGGAPIDHALARYHRYYLAQMLAGAGYFSWKGAAAGLGVCLFGSLKAGRRDGLRLFASTFRRLSGFSARGAL